MERGRRENICTGEYGVATADDQNLYDDVEEYYTSANYYDYLYECDERDRGEAVLAAASPKGRRVIAELKELIANDQADIKEHSLAGRTHRRKRIERRLASKVASKAYTAYIGKSFTEEEFSVVEKLYVKPYQPAMGEKQVTSETKESYDDVKLRAANDDSLQ